jgi:hypothetical protein
MGDRISVDLIGPLQPTMRGSRWILTIVDSCTSFVEIIPIVAKTALAVANAFIQEWITRYGPPRTILSDQGTEFWNETMYLVCSILGCAQIRTTGYRPQTNGKCERVNREINSKMKMILPHLRGEWDSVLGFIRWNLNAAVKETTGFSAWELVYGLPPAPQIDKFWSNMCLAPSSLDPSDRAVYTRVRKLLDWNHNQLSAINSNLHEERVKQYAKSHRKPAKIEEGDSVLYWRPWDVGDIARKWASHWHGPYKVLRKFHDRLYELEDKAGGPNARFRAHVDCLNKFVKREDAPQIVDLENDDEGFDYSVIRGLSREDFPEYHKHLMATREKKAAGLLPEGPSPPAVLDLIKVGRFLIVRTSQEDPLSWRVARNLRHNVEASTITVRMYGLSDPSHPSGVWEPVFQDEDGNAFLGGAAARWDPKHKYYVVPMNGQRFKAVTRDVSLGDIIQEVVLTPSKQVPEGDLDLLHKRSRS